MSHNRTNTFPKATTFAEYNFVFVSFVVARNITEYSFDFVFFV
jgi:hypothetical protein